MKIRSFLGEDAYAIILSGRFLPLRSKGVSDVSVDAITGVLVPDFFVEVALNKSSAYTVVGSLELSPNIEPMNVVAFLFQTLAYMRGRIVFDSVVTISEFPRAS